MTFVASFELHVVFMCYPGQFLALHVILLYAVTFPLLRIVKGCQVVTLLHIPAFDDLFIIKLVGKCGLQVLSRTMLEEGKLVVIC